MNDADDAGMKPAEAGGRRGLVARVAELLTASPARSVVFRGPAGIGKTYVAQAVLNRLATIAPRPAIRRVTGGEAQRHLDFGALMHFLDLDAPPVSAEFELVQRLRRGLVEQATPTVVCIDDVGMLDRKSAAVIESVLRSGDVTVLVTERTTSRGERDGDHHLTGVLAELAEPIIVEPLAGVALEGLVVEMAGLGEVGSVRRVAAMSDGNPLAVRELIASARANHSIVERDGLWHLGDFVPSGRSLEGLVESHLRRLSPYEWDLLRTIAIAGAVPRSVLARIDVEALERLERSGLVGADPCELLHPLYAEVIRGQLVGEETRRLCAKLASGVGPDDGVDPARLGSWMLDSHVEIDDSVARRGAAVAVGRWENRLARDLIEAIDSPTVADLVQLVWAHANGADLAGALDIAERAVSAATSETERVDAGLARAELWCLQLGRSDEGYIALGELRAGLTQPEQMARVDGATALYLRMTGKGPLAAEPTATAVGADITSDSARLPGLIADAFGHVFNGAFDAAGPVISQGYEVAERLQQPHNVVRIAIVDALRHLLAGQLNLAGDLIDRSLRSADISSVRPAHAAWLGLASQLAALRGDLERARLRSHEAARAADHVNDIGAGGFVRGEYRAVLAEIGFDAEIDPAESPIGRARAELRLVDDDVVDERAAELTRSALNAGYVLWAPWIAMEAVRRGPAALSAALVIETAQPLDGAIMAGFVAHASGSLSRDIDQVASAVDSFLRCDATALALDALLTEIDIAIEVSADHLEIRRHVLAARSLANRFTPHPPPRLGARIAQASEVVDMPSDRQLEIARLVATGLSSKDVAAELIVSARTVDNHLAAVYRKFGIASRAELAELPL